MSGYAPAVADFGFARDLEPDERLELGAFPGETDDGSALVWPGLAHVEFDAEIGIKEGTAKGQDDPPVDVTGRKARGVTITLEWLAGEDDANDRLARAWIKAVFWGPNGCKARDIAHPDAEMYAVKRVVLNKLGKKERVGAAHWKIQVSGKSAGKPKPTTAGGAKGDGSAGKADDAGAKWKAGHPPVGQVPIGSNGNQVGGFNQPDAPAAKP